MDKNSVIATVKKYQSELIKIFPEAITYLFGSYAKGIADYESDIDVAVILPCLSDNYLLEDAPRLWRLSADINPDIEPVMLEQGEDSPLYQEIMNTGILIN